MFCFFAITGSQEHNVRTLAEWSEGEVAQNCHVINMVYFLLLQEVRKVTLEQLPNGRTVKLHKIVLSLIETAYNKTLSLYVNVSTCTVQ